MIGGAHDNPNYQDYEDGDHIYNYTPLQIQNQPCIETFHNRDHQLFEEYPRSLMLDANNCYLDTNMQFLYKNGIGLDEKFEFDVVRLNTILADSLQLITTTTTISYYDD